jgi:hypothetical protein
METQIEYYYGETLRWSFGFDNPNKAAVLFACAIPLLWYLWWSSWRLGRLWLRLPALLVSAGLLAGAWVCLIMTYSRGGLVAAAAGLAYMAGLGLWQARKRAAPCRKDVRLWLSVLLVCAMIGGTVWNGLGARSASALGNDRSVGNRVELWGSALQMAAENPAGFGPGKSGGQYMQWYQPLAHEQGYRTMVNSYLTFLVERGWFLSLGILAAFMFFWNWTRAVEGQALVPALRASLLAFLVAAVFSTIMEEGRLWILPAATATLLAIVALRKRRVFHRRSLVPAMALALSACVALWLAGGFKSRSDSLRRDFGKIGGHRTVTAVGPRNSAVSTLGCLLDEKIVGDQHARLLRELAMAAKVRILTGNGAKTADHILAMGCGVHLLGNPSASRLWLLAPEIVTPSQVSALSKSGKAVELILPEIDEDGRVEFWEGFANGTGKEQFSATSLPGVGNRVDWAWSDVIEIIKTG